jgi:hypothetical protein
MQTENHVRHIVAFVPFVCALALPAPSAAQSQTDRFDLLCKNQASEAADLKLSVLVYSNGAEVTVANASSAATYPANVYVNAITWTDGQARFSADRFTGVLKATPGERSYTCEKIGGKKF